MVTISKVPELIPITNRPTINIYGLMAKHSKTTPTTTRTLLPNRDHLRPMQSARTPAGNAPNIPPTANIDTEVAHSKLEKLWLVTKVLLSLPLSELRTAYKKERERGIYIYIHSLT